MARKRSKTVAAKPDLELQECRARIADADNVILAIAEAERLIRVLGRAMLVDARTDTDKPVETLDMSFDGENE